MGGLRAQGVVFLAQGDVRKLFQSLHKLVLADVQVLVFWTCFLYFKPKCTMLSYKPVQAIYQPASSDLGPSS